MSSLSKSVELLAKFLGTELKDVFGSELRDPILNWRVVWAFLISHLTGKWMSMTPTMVGGEKVTGKGIIWGCIKDFDVDSQPGKGVIRFSRVIIVRKNRTDEMLMFREIEFNLAGFTPALSANKKKLLATAVDGEQFIIHLDGEIPK